MAQNGIDLPYPPSWANRLMDWIESLPGPAWLYYLAMTAIVAAAYFFAQWRENGHPFVVSQVALLALGNAFYYLGAIHYLDKIARDAMTRFQPAIKSSAQRVVELEYRLTTMPARTVWLMTLLGLLMAILFMAGIVSGLLVYPGPALLASAPATLVEFTIVLLLGVFFAVAVYHTVDQLHTVSIIYTELTKIDLFNQNPLHAFARLAAFTAVAWMVPHYFWLTAGLQAAAFDVAIGFLSVTMILGLITFFWPLQGIHRLLAAKKLQMQGEVGRRLEKSLQLFAQALDKDDLGKMEAIEKTILNAQHERQIVDTIPTWPWQPGLLRGAATAFFLPLIVWGATRILEMFFGP